MAAPLPPPAPQGAAYWAATEKCVVCQRADFASGFGPRTMVTCETCLDKGTHVDCWHLHSGELLTEERLASPAFQWFCSEGCRSVNDRMVELTGVARPLRQPGPGGALGEYSVELVRWSERDKGCQKTVGHAKGIFNSAFSPLVMENGRNLIDMVCEAYESPDQPGAEPEAGDIAGGGGSSGKADEGQVQRAEFNFSTFRVLLLRKRGIVVSAATVRAFGTHFAEVPFVATREGYRREGHCRRLMQELEGLLRDMGVGFIIVPAMSAVLPMWLRKFGYRQFSQEECGMLEERIVMPDPSSATLVHKQLEAPAPAAEARQGGGRKGKAAAVQTKKGRSVRFGVVTYAESSSSDDEEESGGKNGGGGASGRQKRSKAGNSRAPAASKKESGGSDYEMSSSSSQEEAGEEEEWECQRCKRHSDTCISSAATGKPEDLGDPGGPSGAAAPPVAAAAAVSSVRPGVETGAGQVAKKICITCGADRAGLVECMPCCRYRQKHGGQPRPETLWAWVKQWRQPRQEARQAQALGSSTPAPRTVPPVAAGRSGASKAAAAAGAAPRATASAQRQQSEASRRSVRSSLRLVQAVKMAGSRADDAASLLAGGQLLVEQMVGDYLAEHVLGLVRGGDEQHTEVVRQYEEGALRDQVALAQERVKVAAAEARVATAEAVNAEQAAMLAELNGRLQMLALVSQAQLPGAVECEQQLAAAVAKREQQLAAAAAKREQELLGEIERLKVQLHQQQGQQEHQEQEQELLQEAGAWTGAASVQPGLVTVYAEVPAAGMAATAEGSESPLAMSIGAEGDESVPGNSEAAPAPAAAAAAAAELAASSPAAAGLAPAAASATVSSLAAQAGPSLQSPAAGLGEGSGRQRLATGRAFSNSAARRKSLRSRPVPPDLAAADSVAAAMEAAADKSQEARPQVQQQLLLSGGRGGNGGGWGAGAGVPSAAGSEDLFGIFGGLGGGGSCGDSVGPSMGPADDLAAGAPEPAPTSLPASATTSLDRVAPDAATEADAAPSGGGRHPNLAAKLRLALGSQESCSQGALHGTQPAAAPAPAAGAAAPMAQLAALDLCQQQPVPVPAKLLQASALRSSSLADADAAMRAVEDIAQYLAD